MTTLLSTTTTENSEIDHIAASELYRFHTFDVFPEFSTDTRRKLAIAGFFYRQNECVAPCCGVKFDLKEIDENVDYSANFFRKAHRTKISALGKRCPFLLCKFGSNIDDLQPPLSNQQLTNWNDAEDPEYANFNVRLESLRKWPETQQNRIQSAQQTYVTPQNLAKYGFYFTGPDDGVTCFYCGNTLANWTAAIASTNEHIVQLEHARFFPCRFITYSVGGKFVTNAGYFHIVSSEEYRDRNPIPGQRVTTNDSSIHKPTTIDDCLATFDNWPSSAPVSAQALAETGFYYLGKDFDVKCFMCDLEVSDWRYEMTAIGTHRKRRNDCPIILAMDSAKTGDIQTVNEKWRLETLTGLSFSNRSNSNTPGQADRDQRLCRELAACGFYRVKNSKNIRCAYCGVTIEPKFELSIMTQHRYLAKQLVKRRTVSAFDLQGFPPVDCLIVRAQCPANIVIPDRERFPEFRQFQSIFDRIKSFEPYKEKKKVKDAVIRDMAEAGFFYDDQRRMRCFQCGNSLSIHDRAREKKFPNYTMAQIHAHYYPTCEWLKEILGEKYIAQVFYDRFKSNEPNPQSQSSIETVSSQTSISTLHESIVSTVMSPATTDIVSPTSIQNFHELHDSDQSTETSDDEGFETVVPPPKSFFNKPQEIRSPPSSASAIGTATIGIAEVCSDSEISLNRSQLTSPIMAAQINPFKQLAERNQQQQQDNRERSENSFSSDGGAPEMSPSLGPTSAASSPADIRSLLAHESNRLDTFKRLGRDTFAQIPITELAYAGFYLTAEGDRIECPWCEVRLSEERVETVMRTRPSVVRVGVSDEPWTAMRVHRHENGLLMGQRHSWCTWVRRETGGLYPNVTLLQSQMLYPEYPSYGKTETRSQSFTEEWDYPSGSRLSNEIMAHAGFFYMGGDSVCCYYCGNKLQKFEPRDCPFEEHATFYPLCDYIQKIRGIDYVNRILLENGRTPQGRLKYEMDGSRKIKRIVFDRSGVTKRKTERPPVNRFNSHASRSSSAIIRRSNSRPISSDQQENIEDACLLCDERVATHEYDPCGHYPMCGECSAQLGCQHLERCMVCFKPATIRMRVPTTPSSQ